MKTHLIAGLAALALCSCASAKQGIASTTNIQDFLKLDLIVQVEVTYAPTGDFSSPDIETNVSKDSQFVSYLQSQIRQLPSSGSIYKDFPADIPQWKVVLTDAKNRKATLHIFGVKLRSPETRGGSFYADTKGAEDRLVKHVKSLKTFRNKGSPNNTSDGIRQPADGLTKPSM